MLITILFSFILLINIFFLFKSVYQLFRIMPSVKTLRKITGIKNIGSNKRDLNQFFADGSQRFVKDIVLKYFYKNNNREEIELALRRTGSSDTYEMFLAKTIIYPIVAVIGSFLLGELLGDKLLGIPAISYLFKGVGALVGFLLLFQPKTELNKNLNSKDEKVILEMPRFIRTYRYSPDSKGFDRVVEDYLKTAKEGLKYDLTVLKADIELVGEEKALQNFSDRISIPEVREFVTVVLTALKGGKEESDMNLFFVESKFQDKLDRIIDVEMKKRPEVLDIVNSILLNSLGILIIAPMAIHSISGLGQILR